MRVKRKNDMKQQKLELNTVNCVARVRARATASELSKEIERKESALLLSSENHQMKVKKKIRLTKTMRDNIETVCGLVTLKTRTREQGQKKLNVKKNEYLKPNFKWYSAGATTVTLFAMPHNNCRHDATKNA